MFGEAKFMGSNPLIPYLDTKTQNFNRGSSKNKFGIQTND